MKGKFIVEKHEYIPSSDPINDLPVPVLLKRYEGLTQLEVYKIFLYAMITHPDGDTRDNTIEDYAWVDSETGHEMSLMIIRD